MNINPLSSSSSQSTSLQPPAAAKLQADAKTGNAQAPLLTSEQRRLIALTKIRDEQLKQLVPFFQEYEKTISLDALGFLTPKEICDLARCTLLVVDQQSNAKECTAQFLSTLEKGKPLDLTKAQLTDELNLLWKKRNIPEDRQLKLRKVIVITDSLLRLDEYLHTPISSRVEPVELSVRKPVLRYLFKLVADISKLFEPIHQKALSDVEQFFKELSFAKQKHKKKINISIINYNTRAADHIRLMSQLIRGLDVFLKDQTAQLKQQCSSFNIEDPTVLKQIDRILELEARNYSRFSSRTYGMISELQSFELYLATMCRANITSESVKSRFKAFCKTINCVLVTNFYEGLQKDCETLIEAHSKELSQTPISKEELRASFNRLASQLTSKSRASSRKPSQANFKIKGIFAICMDQLATSIESHRERFKVGVMGTFAFYTGCSLKENYNLSYESGIEKFKMDLLECRDGAEELQNNGKEALEYLSIFCKDEIVNAWQKEKRSTQEALDTLEKSKSRLNKTDVLLNNNDAAETQYMCTRISGMQNSVFTSSAAFNLLSSAYRGIVGSAEEGATKAHLWLQELVLKEEHDAKKALALQTSRNEKESGSKESSIESPPSSPMHATTATSAAAATPTTTSASSFTPIPLATSPHLTPDSTMIFSLHNAIAQWYSASSSEIIAPASLLGAKPTPKSIALHQQLYALDNFAWTLEMLEGSPALVSKGALIKRALLWGYLALEQGLATEHAIVFPHQTLTHRLSTLLQDLQIGHQSLWTTHNNCGTLYARYPFGFVLERRNAPFALKHMLKPNADTAKEFYSQLPVWVGQVPLFHAKVLRMPHVTHQPPLLKVIQDLGAKKITASEQQAKGKTDVEKENTEKNHKSAAKEEDAKKSAVAKVETATTTSTATSLSKRVKKLEVKFKEALTMLQKRIHDLETITAVSSQFQLIDSRLEELNLLRNANHHLEMLNENVLLISLFPQQRFLHGHAQAVLFSGQYFIENLWRYGCTKQRVDCSEFGHDLSAYQKAGDFNKTLSSNATVILDSINVQKGSEYPYRYFSEHKKVSKAMSMMSDLYARSKEATLLGEGAVPSGKKTKSVEALRDELLTFAESLADLSFACASINL